MFGARLRGRQISRSVTKREIDELVGLLIRTQGEENNLHGAELSPSLHQRIRVRIEAEQQRRAGEVQAWGMLFLQGLYVLPILALLALVVMGVGFTSIGQRSYASGQPSAALVTPAIALNEIAPFSNDELMAATIESDDRDGCRQTPAGDSFHSEPCPK